MNEQTPKFELKDGAQVQTQKFGFISAHTITDEKALQMLKLSKGYLKYFQKYPDNWEELTGHKPTELTFVEKLVAMKGIGKATAEKIAAAHKDEAALSEHVKGGGELDYSANAVAALKEAYAG